MSSVIRRLPFVGSVIGRNQTMMVLQTLSALLARGVILSQALKVTVNAVSDEGPTRDALQESWKRVEGGETLAGAFKATNLLPGSTLEVIRIGEESGDLAEMIGKAADDMRENADRELERFLALFQPALIIIVGLMIGVSLYALFSAIVSVNAISI
jgi:general secretion pathway protein F